MKRLLRPSVVLLFLALAAAGAAFWVFESTAMPARPVPLPVGAGDREVAWLYSATGSVNWQRFVQAVEKVPGAETGRAFPELTTTVPEVALALPGGRLLFRWYKVTSEWKTDYWLKARSGARRRRWPSSAATPPTSPPIRPCNCAWPPRAWPRKTGRCSC